MSPSRCSTRSLMPALGDDLAPDARAARQVERRSRAASRGACTAPPRTSRARRRRRAAPSAACGELDRLGDFRGRQTRQLVLAGDVEPPVLLVLGRLAMDLEAAAVAHDALEVAVPLPVGGRVLQPRADVGVRGRVEPLARALGQRERVAVLLEDVQARRGFRTAAACRRPAARAPRRRARRVAGPFSSCAEARPAAARRRRRARPAIAVHRVRAGQRREVRPRSRPAPAGRPARGLHAHRAAPYSAATCYSRPEASRGLFGLAAAGARRDRGPASQKPGSARSMPTISPELLGAARAAGGQQLQVAAARAPRRAARSARRPTAPAAGRRRRRRRSRGCR